MSIPAVTPGRSALEASPELALVDAELAERAREHLAAPDDTLSRLEHDIWLRRLAALDAANVGGQSAGRTRRGRDGADPPHRRTRRIRALAAGAAAVTVTLALLLGVNVNLRGDRAGAESYEASSPAMPPQSTRATTDADAAPRPGAAVGKRAPRAPSRRTFAWAPVANATGYHVEFFRAERRIFATDVNSPHLSLPATWKHASREHRLEPGAYRWYVWPVVSGLRQSQATVQAELVVR